MLQQRKIQNIHLYQSFLSNKEKLGISFFVFLLFASFFFDDQLLKFLLGHRAEIFDGFMLFITDFGLLFGIIVLAVYLFINKKYKELTLIFLTAAFALEISYILKIIFQTPRPFAAPILATIPLTQASGFSMPSLHTAICFSVWPFISKIIPFNNKKLAYFCYLSLFLIALSRLYLGVHYLSDILAGGLIGFTLGRLWLFLEEKYKVLEWFIFHVKDKLELRRQIAHFFIGTTIVFLLKLQLLNEDILFVILLLGGCLSLILRKKRIAFFDKIFDYFERSIDRRVFPGKGPFFLVLGSLFAVLFFQRDIALAAISIMTVGDAITTIVGTYFGKIKNPLNPKKHLEGTIIAIFASTLAAFFFVDFRLALFGSMIGMIMESVAIRYFRHIIDDNLIIPVIAGLAMTLLR